MSDFVKSLDPFTEVERRVEIAVRKAMRMLPEQPEIVTKADLTILANERAVIMAPCAQDWALPYPASPQVRESDLEEHGAWVLTVCDEHGGDDYARVAGTSLYVVIDAAKRALA